jgi:hypothetical protein
MKPSPSGAPARRVRRPEVARIAAQLQRNNPSWTEEQAMTQAKVIATRAPRQGH